MGESSSELLRTLIDEFIDFPLQTLFDKELNSSLLFIGVETMVELEIFFLFSSDILLLLP